jgi:hypothetical protein
LHDENARSITKAADRITRFFFIFFFMHRK